MKESCNPNQYCGTVEIHNVGPALIDNVYAEITTYTLIDPPEALRCRSVQRLRR